MAESERKKVKLNASEKTHLIYFQKGIVLSVLKKKSEAKQKLVELFDRTQQFFS